MVEACEFETARLVVTGWHATRLPGGRGLPDVVMELLTPAVTRPLPHDWQGPFTPERARSWIAERDLEGTTLLATERSSAEPVALIILGEEPVGADGVAVRLGYLVAESAWGRGFASELVAGLVSWCRSRQRIHSITGGTEPDNAASARVLTKNGFVPVPGAAGTGERYFVLRLRAGSR